MKLKRIKNLVLAGTLSLILFNCSVAPKERLLSKQKIGDFSAISTKSVSYKSEGAKRISGRAGNKIENGKIVSLNTSNNEDLQSEAVENALDSAGVGYNLLIDARIYYIRTTMFEGYEVKGTAVKNILK